MDMINTDPLPKKASRRGRYRKSLLDPQSLLSIAHQLETFFNQLDQKRQHGIVSDAEFLSCGLLTLLACRRPDAFQNHRGHKREAVATKTTAGVFTMADFWHLLDEQHLPLKHYQKILDQSLSVSQFLNRIRFRGIPDSARTSLLKWLDQEYPLTLVFHIPSVDEVFALQKCGGRCVSFLKQADDLTKVHHDRDTISFIVHDLIHAHEFYAHAKRARQQIGFYHWLDNIRGNSRLIELLATSDAFRERWEYILSDMNSYCGHLLQTLHAAFSLHARAVQGESLWNTIVDGSDLAPNEKVMFQKINSSAWCETDFLQLEAILEEIAFIKQNSPSMY